MTFIEIARLNKDLEFRDKLENCFRIKNGKLEMLVDMQYYQFDNVCSHLNEPLTIVQGTEQRIICTYVNESGDIRDALKDSSVDKRLKIKFGGDWKLIKEEIIAID